MTDAEKCECGCGKTAVSSACLDRDVFSHSPEVKAVQDKIIANVITLARACVDASPSMKRDVLFAEALYATVADVQFDVGRLNKLYSRLVTATLANGGAPRYYIEEMEKGKPDEVALRKVLLNGVQSMATSAWHAALLGKADAWVSRVLMQCLTEIGKPSHEPEEWDDIFATFAAANLRCMELAEAAHDELFGEPTPVDVCTGHEKGPFIIVSGHGFGDLKQLLEQVEGTGISVYTHGQLLPAHASPVLRQYSALKGNFGTEWQNQQKEFAGVPGAILLTTDCFLPPTDAYADRTFKTGTMGFPGVTHIIADPDGKKDFTLVIDKARELGGWPSAEEGKTLKTGFGRLAVAAMGDALRSAVSSGAIQKFYLMGGCECVPGNGENVYAEFASSLPPDTVLLTLACGKSRFHPLDLGEINGVPRVIDIGGCNDGYAAIQAVLGIARELKRDIASLPLTVELSWYEKKSIAALMTLLEIGVKDIELNCSMKGHVPKALNEIIERKYGVKFQ